MKIINKGFKLSNSVALGHTPTFFFFLRNSSFLTNPICRPYLMTSCPIAHIPHLVELIVGFKG